MNLFRHLFSKITKPVILKTKEEINWSEVEERLIKRDMNLYYVGGTLSVSLDNKRFVALNLNGHGFDQDDNKLIQPENILEIVRSIYLEVKGSTAYYKEEVSSAA